MLKDENRRYFWNENNRLIGWQSNDQQEQAWMTYDGLGRLISETTQTVEFITKSDFVYDGWNLIQETTFQSGTEQKVNFFIWGEDLSGTSQGAGGVGGLLACQNDKDGLSYFLMDGNGNVLGLTDSMGRSQAQYRYDAFGNVSMQLGSNAKSNRFRFSTKRENERSGLLYYGYRHYDPVTGRWPSRDPIEERGGVNLYGFVGNNSVGKIDFLGLEVQVVFDRLDSGNYDLFVEVFENNNKILAQWIRVLNEMSDAQYEKFRNARNDKGGIYLNGNKINVAKAEFIRLIEKEKNSAAHRVEGDFTDFLRKIRELTLSLTAEYDMVGAFFHSDDEGGSEIGGQRIPRDEVLEFLNLATNGEGHGSPAKSVIVTCYQVEGCREKPTLTGGKVTQSHANCRMELETYKLGKFIEKEK